MARSMSRRNPSPKKPAATRRCRLSLELLEGRVVPSIFTVTNTNDTGPGSLRQAILNVNADTLTDTIAFNIGNGGVQTIQPHSALPTITNHVVIDGTTQPGYAGAPLIVLNGVSAGTNANGLILSGGNSTVQGLVVNDFQAAGILLSIHGNDLVQGNFLGTDATGTTAHGNLYGVRADRGSNQNIIGGNFSADRNVASGNRGYGIEVLGTDNLIVGNFIGTDVTGTHAVPNGQESTGGMFIGGDNTTVGGIVRGSGNLISGNGGFGILVNGSGGHLIEGNFIGTDVTGTRPVGNSFDGVYLGSIPNTTIGGTLSGAGNLISGNGMDGVGVAGFNDVVQGNRIGTDTTGRLSLGNGQNGVNVFGTGMTVGGTMPGSGNVISGNVADGVTLSNFGQRELVQGNLIGTDVTGSLSLGNHGYGVSVFSAGDMIGGTILGAGNVISANFLAGIHIAGYLAVSNLIEGNFVGTDMRGMVPLGNQRGVLIDNLASANRIGGTDFGARNIISGNTDAGVLLGGTANLVQGNFIGTDATGNNPIPNLVGVDVESSNNTIGGTEAGARNVVSGNLTDGVSISSSNTFVEGNFIGTTARGAAALSNGRNGIAITGPSNAVGGTVAGAPNLISGNGYTGVQITGVGALHNAILGNNIGTDVSGVFALGNGPEDGAGSGSGVLILLASENTIGGNVAGARNVISGNLGAGVSISTRGLGQADDNLILGNILGTTAAGTSALPNLEGVFISGVGNTVGGSTPAARNLISGNAFAGIWIASHGSENLIEGNYIGTDVSGTVSLGNSFGVYITSFGNTIGGTALGAGNLVSGNANSGIGFDSTDANRNIVQGNYIGTDVTGAQALGNQNGLTFTGALDNTIGGTIPGARNLISGNRDDGLNSFRTPGLVIQGNFVGTDTSGSRPLGNGLDGIDITAGLSTVGGSTSGAGNLISGNARDGIRLDYGTLVQGNFIGIDVRGIFGVPNGTGIDIRGSANNTIGGTSAASRNVISANLADGILLVGSGATHNIIQGNFIGTDATATIALGNGGDGVRIDTLASNNTVGGSATGAGNVISGQIGLNAYGINIDGGAANNLVQGNLIGTDATGLMPLGNFRGIHIGNAPNNTIGGTSPGTGNVISANMGSGILLDGVGGTGTLIQGNLIGTDSTGTMALGNAVDGIHLFAAVSDTTIGGTAAGAGNVISGNLGNGIRLERGATRTFVLGNFIGTDATGTLPLGNDADGVVFVNDPVFGAPHDNTFGGTAPGAGNVIAYNGIDGVLVDTGTGNAILHNRIFGHDNGLGIELINGGNNNQPFPAVTSATFDGQFTTIAGTLASAPNTTYTIELFINSVPNPSGYGEGERFFASLTVATDADGYASFDLSLPIEVDPGQFVSATATDPTGNTSPFALCVEVTGPGAPAPSWVEPMDGPRRVMSPRGAILSSVAVPSDSSLGFHALYSRLEEQMPFAPMQRDETPPLLAIAAADDSQFDARVLVHL